MAVVTNGKRNYSYDELGRVVSVDYEDGQKAMYSYDEAGNLAVTVAGPAGELRKLPHAAEAGTRPKEKTPLEERVQTEPRPADIRQRCASCGADIRADARFCPSCGIAVTHAPAPQIRYCTSCGQQLSETAKFCKNCGAPVRSP
jgi:YD repeat-containing protein